MSSLRGLIRQCIPFLWAAGVIFMIAFICAWVAAMTTPWWAQPTRTAVHSVVVGRNNKFYVTPTAYFWSRTLLVVAWWGFVGSCGLALAADCYVGAACTPPLPADDGSTRRYT